MLDKINPIGIPQKKDDQQALGSGTNAAFLSSAQPSQPSIFDNTGVIPNGKNLKVGDYLNGQKTA